MSSGEATAAATAFLTVASSSTSVEPSHAGHRRHLRRWSGGSRLQRRIRGLRLTGLVSRSAGGGRRVADDKLSSLWRKVLDLYGLGPTERLGRNGLLHATYARSITGDSSVAGESGGKAIEWRQAALWIPTTLFPPVSVDERVASPVCLFGRPHHGHATGGHQPTPAGRTLQVLEIGLNDHMGQSSADHAMVVAGGRKA